MFWRKKKSVDDRALALYEGSCRRESYRVRPPEWAPVVLEILGLDPQIIDISAGGMSFTGHAALEGMVLPLTVILSGQEKPIVLDLEVLSVDDSKVCHGKFIDPSSEAVEAIHSYVWNVQRKRLSRKW